MTAAKIKRRSLIIGLIFGIMLMFSCIELSPFGGQVEFYSKWMSCGQKPVREPAHFDNMKYYEESPNIDLFRLRPQAYFCTPLEAEKAGYSANQNSYEFPNLRAER